MTAALAVSALSNAVALRDPKDTKVHSDRGSQFRSAAFVTALKSHGLVGSMGRVGACVDNAAMESFFALLQKNVLQPLAAIRMAAGLAAGARVQASAFADMVVDELWHEDAPAVAELMSSGRRARLQLTQAVASLVVHDVGVELRGRATMPGGAGLDELVDGLRVGVVRSRGGQ